MNSQLRSRCRARTAAEIHIMTITLLWACRNFMIGKLMAKANSSGIIHSENFPASSAISALCPKSLRMGDAKR
ncbi:unnamed protein product [Spirodela intermedia]|uniref:Uncharacterized protein n=1 Tax=Spirodela intermedia TaxID=51605 RepID=A0A7I8IV42_SPIIN|nr:unnamed protein product [Spirodela intermedia]CAA6661639.1 unnamed protein product [Spirodela intermedia]